MILFGQGDIGAMYLIAPMSTLIWGLSYVICIIVMLMSMVTAILIAHHREVRKKRGRAQQTLPQQCLRMIEDFLWKALRRSLHLKKKTYIYMNMIKCEICT